MKSRKPLFCFRVLFVVIGLAAGTCGWAQTAGTIEGRIQNLASGNFLENARIIVQGTGQETRTSATGEYRLVNVPAGEATVSVRYSGYVEQSKTVTVRAGETARLDYGMELSLTDRLDKVVELETFTVSDRQLSAEASALNEQRVADNLKNVVTFDEFGNMGEGNPGEFLKYVPGVYITMGPAIAVNASVRGFPADGTIVTVDGNPIASTVGARSFELTGAATGNIDRLEVTKSPTPDMPANAIGGGINIRGKSAFTVKKPILTYNAYATFNLLSKNPSNPFPSLKKRVGSESRSTLAPIQPGFDLTYLAPINDRFGITLSASASKRYYDQDFNYAYWNKTTLAMQRTTKQDTLQLYDKRLLSLAVDWKLSSRDRLRFTTQYSSDDSYTAQTNNDVTYGSATVVASFPTGDMDSTQSKPGLGSATSATGGFNFYRNTTLSTLGYVHEGNTWKVEANASYSQARRRRNDIEHGFFTTYGANYTGLTLQATGFGGIPDGLLPRITATKGAAVINVFDAGEMSLNTASTFEQRIDNKLMGANINFQREFFTRIPLKIKVGAMVTRDEVDQIGAINSAYTLAVPASVGARTGRNLGLVAEEFSTAKEWFDIDRNRVAASFLSPDKLYDLYVAHPEYFTRNDTAYHTSVVNTSKLITETITAAYFRTDTRFLANRLRVTAGVRYEQTKDDAVGPLNDITRTYQRDANGNILRTPAGAPIKIVGTAFELAKLQLVERASTSQRKYDDFYPSVNVAFSLKENLVLRAAYARTISRPNLALIIPSMTLPDLTSASARTITLTNSALTASTSNSYDLSLEYYGKKGTFLSAGVFRKDMKDFISSIRTEATQELLDFYGIPDEYLGYDIATSTNFGDASVTGLELAVRKPLVFMPSWARGLSVFANATFLHRSGESAEDLNQFATRSINYGVSFARAKLLVKVNVAMVGDVQLGRVAPSVSVPVDTFRYNPSQTTVDLSIDYRLHKRLSFFLSVRNLLQDSKITSIANAGTPEYARANVHQRIGSLFTVGVKGDF